MGTPSPPRMPQRRRLNASTPPARTHTHTHTQLRRACARARARHTHAHTHTSPCARARGGRGGGAPIKRSHTPRSSPGCHAGPASALQTRPRSHTHAHAPNGMPFMHTRAVPRWSATTCALTRTLGGTRAKVHPRLLITAPATAGAPIPWPRACACPTDLEAATTSANDGGSRLRRDFITSLHRIWQVPGRSRLRELPPEQSSHSRLSRVFQPCASVCAQCRSSKPAP